MAALELRRSEARALVRHALQQLVGGAGELGIVAQPFQCSNSVGHPGVLRGQRLLLKFFPALLPIAFTGLGEQSGDNKSGGAWPSSSVVAAQASFWSSWLSDDTESAAVPLNSVPLERASDGLSSAPSCAGRAQAIGKVVAEVVVVVVSGCRGLAA